MTDEGGLLNAAELTLIKRTLYSARILRWCICHCRLDRGCGSSSQSVHRDRVLCALTAEESSSTRTTSWSTTRHTQGRSLSVALSVTFALFRRETSKPICAVFIRVCWLERKKKLNSSEGIELSTGTKVLKLRNVFLW